MEVKISHYVAELAYWSRLLEEARIPRRWWQSAVSVEHMVDLQNTVNFYAKQLDDAIETKIRDAIFADRRDKYI